MSNHSETRHTPLWAIVLVAFGTALVLLSAAGLWLLSGQPEEQAEFAEQDTPVSATDRPPVASKTMLPMTPSLLPTYGVTPQATTGETLKPTAEPTLAVEATPDLPRTPIAWTEAEKNALSWLCLHEVGGMGSTRIDACLSVVSTVRARYAYSNNFPELDVISTLLKPNQFNIEFDTAQPAPDAELYAAVEQYQNGVRGSCNGYLFFDSVPGGPSLCVIWGAAGQFLEFHNGW